MRGSRGFSLVEVVVASAVVLIASTVMLDSYLYSLKGSKVIQYHFRAWEYKENVENLLKDKTAWAKMLTQNTFKNCLESDAVSSCPPSPAPTTQPPAQSGFLFPVQRADGSSFFDSMNPRAGIDLNGKVCTGFNPQADNRDCPLRAEVRWSPICSGPCTSGKSISQLRVDFSLLGNKSVPNINLAQYQFSLYKSIVAAAPPVVPPPPVILRPGWWHMTRIAASADGKRYFVTGDVYNTYLAIDTEFRGIMLDEDGKIIRDVFPIVSVPTLKMPGNPWEIFADMTNVGNRFVLTLEDGGWDPDPRSTRVYIFDSNGQQVFGSPKVIKAGSTEHGRMFIRSLNNGNKFVVAKISYQSLAGSWMRVFDANGNPTSGEINLAAYSPYDFCGFTHDVKSNKIQFFSRTGGYNGRLYTFDENGVHQGTAQFDPNLFVDCMLENFPVARSADGKFLHLIQTHRNWNKYFHPKTIRAYEIPADPNSPPILKGTATFYAGMTWCTNSAMAGSPDNLPSIGPVLRSGFEDSVIHYSTRNTRCYPTETPTPGRVIVSVGPDGSLAKIFASATSPPHSPLSFNMQNIGGTKFILSAGTDLDQLIIRLYPYEQ